MSAREYLSQAYRLTNRIKLIKSRIVEMRELAYSVSHPGYEEHHNASRNTDAPFMRALEKIEALETELEDRLLLLLNLQTQIEDVIAKLDDIDLQMVLAYRYLKSLSWYKIGSELCVDESTARRWHDKAIAKVVVPEDAIKIKMP